MEAWSCSRFHTIRNRSAVKSFRVYQRDKAKYFPDCQWRRDGMVDMAKNNNYVLYKI